MIDNITAAAREFEYDRVVAFGGGSVIDISKILALNVPEKCINLFNGKTEPRKIKELVIIPTTCGTGSEVTNLSIVELIELGVKQGLAGDFCTADAAVLVPETLSTLPWNFFATSSIDALTHAIESYLSPKANPFTEMFSIRAIEYILEGFVDIYKNGQEARTKHLKNFIIASTYAGIAFGNAGCAAVHAMSYSFAGAFHVAHGEANYQFLGGVLDIYQEKNPDGKIRLLKELLARILDTTMDTAIYQLQVIMDVLVPRKALKEYGMTENQIDAFTVQTIEKQQRLLANNYVPLTQDDIRSVFAKLF